MKCLLIFPPQSMPENPYLSTPILKGILNANGHNTQIMDLNLEFYNYILNPEYIKTSLNKLFEDYKKNAEEIFNQYDESKGISEYPTNFQNKYLKYKKIQKIDKQQAYQKINEVGNYINIIKTGQKEYEKKDIILARVNLWTVLDYVFLPYFDAKIINERFFYFIRNLNQLKEFLSESKNIFYKFYENIVPEIIKKNPDYIGLSICAQSQLLPGLTLAMLLKQKTNAHINIGGSYISKIKETLKTKPEFFELFVDSIIYEEGEIPIIKLMEHLEGKINIEDVPNLLYLKDSEVQMTSKTPTMPLNDIPIADFSDLPLNSYYTDEIVLPMLAERGCYWSKCNFCDICYTGNKYDFKKPEKVVAEIKELQEKFGFKKVSFVSEAMSPAYLRKFSNEILKTGLKINFKIYSRIERDFTEELLSRIKSAGVTEMQWGFESVNERVLGLMNKTKFTDKNERLEIIKTAHRIGIENTGFFMFGFPGETKEEAMETINFIKENEKYIKNCLMSKYMIKEHSPIQERYQDFSISEIYDKDELDLFYFSHKTTEGMSFEEATELFNTFVNDFYTQGEIPYSNYHDAFLSSTFWGF